MEDISNYHLLRADAEALLSKNQEDRPAEELLYELRVHQIELEMQNEALRQAHEALEEARDRYRDLYDFAPVGYLLLDRNGLISEINSTATGQLGLDRSTLLNRRFATLVTADFCDRWYLFFSGVMKHDEGKNIELMIKRNDGTEFPVQLDCLRVTSAEYGPMLRITLTDLTESKAAEAALRTVTLQRQAIEAISASEKSLRDSELKLRAILDASPVAMALSDELQNITYLNPSFVKCFGYTLDDIPTLSDWWPQAYPDPEYREWVADTWRRSYEKAKLEGEEFHPLEISIRCKNGAIKPVLVMAAPLDESYAGNHLVVIFDITERKQSEYLLTQLKAMIEISMDGFWIVDLMGNLLQANEAYARISGYSVDELVGMHISQLDSFDGVEQVKERAAKFAKQGHGQFETRHLHKEGHAIDIEVSVTFLPEFQQFCVFCRDITKRKHAEKAQQIASIAFETQEGMMITDAKGVILQVNKAFTRITGYTDEEAIGNNPRILQSGRQNADFYTAMWADIKNNGAWSGEIWNRRKNGETYPQRLAITAVNDANGIVTNYVGTFTDITMTKAAADEIKYLAFYDPLTGLPNRRLLRDRLKPALASSYRSGRKGALLFIDMDNFKTLNDSLGHDVGDLLLQQIAQRIVLCVREGDTVARLGGDEFVVMLEDLSQQTLEAAAQAETIGHKILSTLNQPYQLDTHHYHCTSSIGAILFNEEDLTVDSLLKQADIAMYQAKAAGRNALRFFDPQMQVSIDARVALEASLHLALTENQFALHFQPQVDHNRRIIGAEVLIRWQHPQNGFISPADFIPLAEGNGLILPIGQWVLETACAQLKIWADSEHTQHLQLAVNVSARQFHQADFVTQVSQAISRSAINPARLKLELTESLVLDDIDDTIHKMHTLRELGVHFSMDDFGTGYSSLSSLKKLPLSQLKIDQSFVRDIASDSDDAVIVQTIIAMAKNLGMGVIAEGVETEMQRAFLEQHGCPLFQGYLFSRPVPIEQFEELFK